MLKAAYEGDLQVLRVLSKKGKRLDIADNHGWTPLHHCAAREHVDCVKYLLGPEFSDYSLTQLKTHEGQTPLLLSCFIGTGNRDIIGLLIQSDPTAIYIPNNELETPLHVACNKEHPAIVELLINAGADLNSKDYGGDTPLHNSALTGNYETLEMLLYAGADVSITNECGYSSLHLSVMSGSELCIKLMLEFICEDTINMQNDSGETALYIAAKQDATQIVELLLENNADPYIRNSAGYLPLHIACFAIKPLILNMDVNLINDFDCDNIHLCFNYPHCDTTKGNLYLLKPEIFELFAMDYIWDFWDIDKYHCIFVIEYLLSHTSLNYCYQRNYVPEFSLVNTSQFIKLLDIADTLVTYGQDINILWEDALILDVHCVQVKIRVPISIWSIRTLCAVSPLYSPHYILKKAKATNVSLEYPKSWEIEFEAGRLRQGLPSLNHLTRCAIRKHFCNRGFISYHKFLKKLRELKLPKRLLLYIQYMEEYCI